MHTPHLTEQKAELRAAILDRIQHMNERERAAESRSIVLRILDVLPPDKTICAFFPLQTEPDIRPLLSEIIARNQPLFLPADLSGEAQRAQAGRLVMRRVRDLSQLHKGPWGIPEPPADAEMPDPEVPIVALIPGRAFDRKGGRLGRGNGGYDRWLATRHGDNGQSLHYGVAFDCQIVSEVPMEEHDVFLDGVITGRGLEPAQK